MATGTRRGMMGRGELALALVAGLVLGAGLLGCRGEVETKPVQPTAPTVATPEPEPEPEPDVTEVEPDVEEPAEETAWWRGAVFYEIFVRSFHDSDGDGVGDLEGLIAKLDYLNDGDPDGGDDLGVDALWLMPINPSPSYHGYDVTDYRDVNPDYGDLETLDRLLAEAKSRGIRVIKDLVINHSSNQHPWFLSAKQGPDADKRDWYTFVDTPPEGWTQPWGPGPVWHQAGDAWYYGIFWSGMPDLNYRNPAVEAEMHDIARFWLARDVAGFRVDAVKHLFETEDGKLADADENHPFLKRFRAAIDKDFPNAVLVAEAWSDADSQARYYGDGDQFHLGFSFDTSAKIRTAVKDGVRSDLNQMLDKAARVFPDPGYEAPFLTNHDMPRVFRDLGEDPARMRLAAALLFAWQGTPFLYYGEELGMVGGEGGADENKRTPMRWNSEPDVGFTTGTPWFAVPDEAPGTDVASQLADPQSLLRLYQRLIALRRTHPALRTGEQARVDVSGGPGVAALSRALGDQRVVLVVNLAAEPSEPFDLPLTGEPRVLYAEGLTAPPTVVDGFASFTALGPRAFAFLAY